MITTRGFQAVNAADRFGPRLLAQPPASAGPGFLRLAMLVLTILAFSLIGSQRTSALIFPEQPGFARRVTDLFRSRLIVGGVSPALSSEDSRSRAAPGTE